MNEGSLPEPKAAPAAIPAWKWAAAVFAASLLAYLPALGGGFVWNDSDYLTKPGLRAVAGLAKIWFKVGATEQYYPVLHSAFWLEYQLWGDAPLGYHLVNVLLHATSACLFALVLIEIGRASSEVGRAIPKVGRAVPSAPSTSPPPASPPPASPLPAPESWAPWFAALLFALHPVCVESVAWVSEQKNTLSTVFYLLAALVFLRWRLGQGPRWPVPAFLRRFGPGATEYAAATALFLLALLSKSVTATLPAALLVVLWWRQGSLRWRRDVRPLAPWFGLGAAVGLFTAWVEHTYVGAEGRDFALAPAERLLVAGRAVWFYLGKLLWPADLIFIYPRWTLRPSDWLQWIPVAAALAATLLLLAAARRGGPSGSGALRARAPLCAWLFFVGSLFPVLGFLNVFAFIFSFVADHFQYLASLGVFALAAGAWAAWRASPALRLGSAAALLAILGLLTWRQSEMYTDVIAFYRTTLERNPSSWMSHLNLGTVLVELGDLPGGIAEMQAGLRLKPDDSLGEYDLGTAYFKQGRLDQAAAHYRRALALEPRRVKAHFGLGTILAKQGRVAEAEAEYRQAVAIAPDYGEAHAALGRILLGQGHPAEAVEELRQGLRYDPGDVEIANLLGAALIQQGQPAEAAEDLQAALRGNPDNAEAQYNLGLALAESGRVPEAIDHFEEAVRLQPRDPDAEVNLAMALAEVGRLGEAADRCREALRINPSFGPARELLARLSAAGAGAP